MDESLSLGAQRGLEEVGVITKGLDGAGGDELCGAGALHLTREETDGGRRAKGDVLLGEPACRGGAELLYKPVL